MTLRAQEHSSFKLEILTVVNNEGEAFDVINVFQQCIINESIYDNFLTGEISFNDGLGMLEKIKFSGQESIRIRFSQVPNNPEGEVNEDEVIDKVFRIYKVNDIHRIDQNNQVFNCKFCSPELMDAKRIRISQAYKGNVLDLAAKISEDYLGIQNSSDVPYAPLVPFFERRQISKEEHHVVIPNWTIHKTLNWLCSKAQSNDYNSGISDCFFFYQTANGGFRINSIKDMMNFKQIDPFIYHSVSGDTPHEGENVPRDETQETLGVGMRILDYYIFSAANVLESTVKGGLASKLTTINNTGKYIQEKTFNIMERFYSDESNSIESEPLMRIEPEKLYIGGASSGEVGAEVHVEGEYNSYKPVTSYPDAFHLLMNQSEFVNDSSGNVNTVHGNSHFGGQQMRQSVSQLLKYHEMRCLISCRTDISVGTLVELHIPMTDAALKDTAAEVFDNPYHSGNHLITDIQWSFNQTICNTKIVDFVFVTLMYHFVGKRLTTSENISLPVFVYVTEGTPSHATSTTCYHKCFGIILIEFVVAIIRVRIVVYI